MAKKNENVKEIKNQKEEVKMKEEIKVNNVEVKSEKELFEDAAKVEVPEMEMELDGEDIMAEMEEVVQEKVKEEEIKNQEQKHKPGPKPKTEEEKAVKKEEKQKEKKETALNLKDPNVIQREIKKGRLTAPCFRIEKVDADNTYDLLEAKGIIFSKHAQYVKYDNTAKMVDGKAMVTLKAAEVYGEKFKGKHENGEEIEHDYVRVELHKPGRAKDVVELYTVREKKNEMKEVEAKLKKKEEEDKKKAEKEAEAKAKEEKEKANKEEIKDAVQKLEEKQAAKA